MKKTAIAIASVAGLILAPLVLPTLFPWPGINGRHEEINVKTGQARYSRRLWFIEIAKRMEDTPLSLALKGETVDVTDIKAWQHVNTFSPGKRHSPHYRFHNALNQAHQLKQLESLHRLTPGREKEIAQSILIAWQMTGSDREADQLLSHLVP